MIASMTRHLFYRRTTFVSLAPARLAPRQCPVEPFALALVLGCAVLCQPAASPRQRLTGRQRA